MLKIIKKTIIILLLAIIFISNFYNIVNAAFEIKDAYIEKIGECEYHLKYYKEEKGMYTYCTCAVVGYNKDGNFYPAYCLNRDLHGVGAVDNYTVDIDSLLDNPSCIFLSSIWNSSGVKSIPCLDITSLISAFCCAFLAS